VTTPGTAALLDDPKVERTLASAPFQESVLSIVGQGKRVNVLTFQRLNAQLTMKGREPSALTLTAQVGSGASNDPKVIERLTDKNLLGAKAHPEARVELDKIEGAAPSLTLTGTLHLRGAKHKVTVPARFEIKPGGVELNADMVLSIQVWREVGKTLPDDLGDRFQVVSKLWFPFPDQAL
jgi:polyisoprenoid-binding protein YceI